MSEEQSVQSTPSPSSQQPQRIVVVPAKSVGLAIFLGVFFGPIGLLYSSVTGAIVMFIVNIVALVATLGFGLFLTWPICGVWAAVAAKSYNEKLLAGQRQY
jgi:hypothetical protein